jgi:hypothetical protein
MVTSYTTSAGSTEVPSESMSLSFTAITMQSVLAGGKKVSWDLLTET